MALANSLNILSNTRATYIYLYIGFNILFRLVTIYLIFFQGQMKCGKHSKVGIISNMCVISAYSYESCCWLGDIQNNGQSVENGKGWNLAATINTDHGDGIINTPPLSSSFPMYHIMEGCEYTLPIPRE